MLQTIQLVGSNIIPMLQFRKLRPREEKFWGHVSPSHVTGTSLWSNRGKDPSMTSSAPSLLLCPVT